MFGSDTNEEERPSGLLERGKSVLSILVQMVHNRLELAATEIQEEYERLWPLLFRSLISIVLLSFGLFFISVFIVVYFWDTHRLEALGAVTAIYLITGLGVALHVNRLWSQRRKLFSSVLAELEKDIQALREP